MRRLIVLLASLVPLVIFAADASAQRRFGGAGFHAGGFRPGGFGGGFRPGMGPRHFGPGFRAGGFRPAFAPGRFGPGFRGGMIAAGPRWGGVNRWYGRRFYARPFVRPAFWGWGRRYYPGYYYGGYPWGWGLAGLAAGTAIGAYPSYPIYEGPAAIGGYCATPVRTCALIDAAPIGTGCSCRVAGGRARGTVVD